MVGLATAKASSYDATTGTGTVWAQGVSQEGGWYDAQKTSYYGDADDYMCYAACAANQIALVAEQRIRQKSVIIRA